MVGLEKKINTTKCNMAEEMVLLEKTQQAQALHLPAVDVKKIFFSVLKNVSKSPEKELKSGLLAKMNNFFSSWTSAGLYYRACSCPWRCIWSLQFCFWSPPDSPACWFVIYTLLRQSGISHSFYMFYPVIFTFFSFLNCISYSWRTKNQLDVTCYFILFIMCSTCFGH